MAMSWLSDFVSLIYPHLCVACGKTMDDKKCCICVTCQYKLPKTNFHSDPKNPVSRVFWGKVNVIKATALFHYKKADRMQKIMHALKYQGKKEAGVQLGEMFGSEVSNFFEDIDVIVPIPLHAIKLKKRGYNQAEAIAEGISSSTNTPMIANVLQRTRHNFSQTTKSRYNRWENSEGLFKQNEKYSLTNKHVLLVDDVITTGATMEAAIIALQQNGYNKISVATLAFA